MTWDPLAALEEERARTQERLGRLTGDYAGIIEAAVDANADDEHDPEGATIAFERSQLGALVEQARLHLAEVDAAIERVRVGSYGTCERCGGPVAPGRLEARPVARTCITCAG
jgi:DnaK suppressor protein